MIIIIIIIILFYVTSLYIYIILIIIIIRHQQRSSSPKNCFGSNKSKITSSKERTSKGGGERSQISTKNKKNEAKKIQDEKMGPQTSRRIGEEENAKGMKIHRRKGHSLLRFAANRWHRGEIGKDVEELWRHGGKGHRGLSKCR